MHVSPERWARISAVFGEIHLLPPATRTARLHELAAGDAALIEEVENLLAVDDDAFLEAPAEFSGPTPLAARSRLVGQAVGAYRVEREIGRGGMGVVYEGHHVDSTLAKRVAIKTLAIGMDRPELTWRFRREREILAKLEHPNIATLYDGGTTEAGVPYLVMEFVHGVRIDTWCAQQTLTIPQRIDLFRQVCAAVQFAHSSLVIHRDLKPGNMLVSERGVVKLLDFGVAKLLETDPRESDDRTIGGITPLTTAYASPEQLRGGEVGTRSDIYSLGVILYRLLAGSLPYAADGKTPSDLLQLISAGPPQAPSMRVTDTDSTSELPGLDARTLRSTLSGELDAIVLMTLRDDPERRYATVDALSADLLRYLKGLPVQARPDTLGYRVRKFVRRQRALVAGIAIGATALVAGTVAATRSANEARLSAKEARAEAERSRNMNRYLQAVVGAADPSWYSLVRGGKDIVFRDVIDTLRVRIARELPDDPATRADLYRTLAGSYRVFNQLGVSLALLDSARTLHTAALGPNAYEVTRDIQSQGTFLQEAGKPDSAIALMRESLQRFRAMTPPADSDLAFAAITLGQALAIHGQQSAAAIPLLEEGTRLETARATPRWQLVVISETTLGTAYTQVGQPDKSDSAFALALRVAARDSLRNLSDYGLLRLNWGTSLGRRGKHAEAAALKRSGLTSVMQVNGPSHYTTAVAQSRLADELIYLGRLTEGRALIDSALTSHAALTPGNPVELCFSLRVRAAFEVAARDFAAATATLARANALLAKTAAARPVLEVNLLLVASDLDLARGRREDAKATLDSAVALAHASLGPTHATSRLADGKLAEFLRIAGTASRGVGGVTTR